MPCKTHVVSIRLTEKEFQALECWRQEIEREIGMDVHLGTFIRRLLGDALVRGREPFDFSATKMLQGSECIESHDGDLQ